MNRQSVASKLISTTPRASFPARGCDSKKVSEVIAALQIETFPHFEYPPSQHADPLPPWLPDRHNARYRAIPTVNNQLLPTLNFANQLGEMRFGFVGGPVHDLNLVNLNISSTAKSVFLSPHDHEIHQDGHPARSRQPIMTVKISAKQTKAGKSVQETCYDKKYFDKWYRNPRHRISTDASTMRKAEMAVGVAEFFLGRKVRRVLDVGCGEGQWQPALMALRPGLNYTGIDSSEYAIQRFGKTRNLRMGSFGDLPTLRSTYDLLICSDCLYYIEEAELIAGLHILVGHLEGIAFLEVYPSEIALEGDTSGMIPRPLAFYRKLFRSVGLISCGPHCYVPPHLHEEVTPMERGWL